MSFPPFSRLLGAAFFFAAAPCLPAEWARPDGFFTHEKIERREIAHGIEWIAASGEWEGQPVRTQILAVDLKKSGVTLSNLFSHQAVGEGTRQRVPRSGVSRLARENGALAAINTAFFDIKGTQSPSGFLLHGGRVLREPQQGAPTLLFFDQGTAMIAQAEWKATLTVDGKEHKVATVNSPYLPDGAFVLYRAPWRHSPGKGAFTKKEVEQPPVTEIVVSLKKEPPQSHPSFTLRTRGAVREVRRDQPPVPIRAGEVVVAFKGGLPFPVAEGAAVTIEELTRYDIGMGEPEPLEASDGFSGKPLLVRDGETREEPTKLWKDLHPRSAVGIDEPGERLLLVAVDGRSRESAGVSLLTLARFMKHLGSNAAFNFDGGGSTTLGAVVDGKWRVLNTPSDGSERPVPVALGLIPRPVNKK